MPTESHSAVPRELLGLPTLGGKQLWADEAILGEWRVQRHVMTGHARLIGPGPGNVRRATGTLEHCLAEMRARRESGEIPAPQPHAVFVLHGLWRAKESMRKLQTALRGRGFEAMLVNYPSLFGSIEDHAAQLARIVARLEGVESISFTGHSLGGLVIRRMLADVRDPRIRRVVMIATPNRGAILADWITNAKPLGAFLGKTGVQLRIDAYADCPAPWCEFGVIAGGRGDVWGFNPLLRCDNDFTVEVENTKLEGMKDFLLVPRIHSYIMGAKDTIAATIRFFDEGRFSD